MTPDERYEIAVLAEDYETKRLHHEYQAMTNCPTDILKRQKAMVEYHLAQAEMIEARNRLTHAQMKLGAC